MKESTRDVLLASTHHKHGEGSYIMIAHAYDDILGYPYSSYAFNVGDGGVSHDLAGDLSNGGIPSVEISLVVACSSFPR